MKILELNLKAKWFDMILSGEKTEEYREIKDYWIYRLTPYKTCGDKLKFLLENKLFGEAEHLLVIMSDYDAIRFSNGYAKDRRQMLVKLKNISIGIGNPTWGAMNEETFILTLGDILETKNCLKL